MKTIFAPWMETLNFSDADHVHLGQVWITSRTFREYRQPLVNRGKLVRPFGEVLPKNSLVLCDWWEYARRTARAWNALALVRHFAERDVFPSPLQAYESAMDLEEYQLASFLLRSFKDDPEILAAQKEAQELYSDPSIPF